ncbi:Fe-S oxidoreductase [Bacillus canaveralius]|nr:Fe-S oxidoreductase [Bacillus canaveralius]
MKFVIRMIKMNSMMMNKLKTFNIHLEHEKPKDIEMSDLLNEEKCRVFLQKLMLQIKAPNLSVAASMFSKRYAYLIVASTLYSMVQYNCTLKLPVKACALSKERELCIQLECCPWEETTNLEREQWRVNVLRSLFSEHITPVLNTLQKTSRLSPSILWENVAIRINSIYRKILSRDVELVKIERLNSDFQFLKNAEGDLFNLKENPIKEYLKIGEELEQNPFRKTCCMYYLLEEDLEGIGYCRICPIKSKLQRIGN